MAGLTLRTAASRELGGTESNWCLALEGGTGHTVIGILFGQRLKVAAVEATVRSLLASQPLLRATIVEKERNKLWFEISEDVPDLKVEVLDRSERGELDGAADDAEDEDAVTEPWLTILEAELNTGEKRLPVIRVRLYNLPEEDTLLVLRLHPATADMFGTAAITTHLLQSLKNNMESDNLEEQFEKLARVSAGEVEVGITSEAWDLPAIESAVPLEKSKKPFWAHGVDALGYGLVSRRFAYLAFEKPQEARRTRLIRGALTRDQTEALWQTSSQKKSDLYGAVVAAGMKAAAQIKNTGNRGEHYAVAVLYNCRASLEPVIPAEAAGFYNSALLRTTHVKETEDYWQLAAKCTREFNDLIKNNKHFTDIGILNMMMVQAIHHPGLTPSGSMRTALLSIDHQPSSVDLSAEVTILKVKDRVICSSTHGVGPCVSIFQFLQEGQLKFSFMYNTPLFSRQYIQRYIDALLDNLVSNL